MTRWLVVGLCACGRVGFDPHTDAAAADASNQFGAPMRLTELESNVSDIVPTLRADQLEIIFGSLRPPSGGAFLLWDATRTAAGEPFAAPQELIIPNATSASEPALSDDGLQLYFRRNSSTLAFTDRATLAPDAWAAATVANELVGFTGADYIGDLRMVLSDETNGALFETTRADRHAAWATPKRIDELVVPGVRTEFPTASADGLEIIFQTDTAGLYQLAHAFRPALDQPFGVIVPIDAGFPTVNVGDPELTHDGHALFMTVENSPGNYDLYVMMR